MFIDIVILGLVT